MKERIIILDQPVPWSLTPGPDPRGKSIPCHVKKLVSHIRTDKFPVTNHFACGENSDGAAVAAFITSEEAEVLLRGENGDYR